MEVRNQKGNVMKHEEGDLKQPQQLAALASDRLMVSEIEGLRQAQNEAVAYCQTIYPNLRILQHSPIAGEDAEKLC